MICYCCGFNNLEIRETLWKELIDDWRLSPYEVGYISRQQGLCCLECHSNLRSMSLALSIMRCFGYEGLFKNFVKQNQIKNLKILEINEAGSLTKFLSQLPGHTLEVYPQINMTCINFLDRSFDLVVHSDVLEHVKYPIRGLSECYRVLKPGGYCAFTIPIIVDRLTISRDGMSPSYHGSEENRSDFIVHTEYGCDAWKHVIQAGFQECRVFSIEYPAAQALVGVK